MGIGPARRLLTPALVEAARANCLIVHPYTVNDEGEMRALLALGVDGMFTDDPDRLSAVVGLRGTGSRTGVEPGAGGGRGRCGRR